MESASSSRTAVIIAAQVEMLEPLVVAAGFDVIGAADCVVNGERLAVHFRPDVVIIENDLPGEPGWRAVAGLRAANPSTQVVLVVNEDWTPHDVGATGAFAVLTRSRLSELVTELGGLDRWLTGAQDRSHPHGERRMDRDRREHQDWSKVGWERRSLTRRDEELKRPA